MSDGDHWREYNQAQAGRGPRELCLQAIEVAGPGRGRAALDLGAGAGVESRALADAGWQVNAFDLDSALVERLSDTDVQVRIGSMTEVDLPPADLVHAGFSLPFVPPAAFPALWERIRAALRPGGLLAVNLFGVHDEWAGEPDMTFHSRADVEALTSGLEVIDLTEVDEDGPAYSGPKHWHLFSVLARRPA